MPSVKKLFCAAHTSRVRSYILLTWRQDIYINYVEFFYMGDWTILLIDALNHSFIPVWIHEYSFYNVDHNPVLPSVLWYSNCSSFHVRWEMADSSTRAGNIPNQPWDSCTASKCRKNKTPQWCLRVQGHSMGDSKRASRFSASLNFQPLTAAGSESFVRSTELSFIVGGNIRIQMDLTHFQVIWLQDYNLSVSFNFTVLHYVYWCSSTWTFFFAFSIIYLSIQKGVHFFVLVVNYYTQTC